MNVTNQPPNFNRRDALALAGATALAGTAAKADSEPNAEFVRHGMAFDAVQADIYRLGYREGQEDVLKLMKAMMSGKKEAV